MHQIAQGGGRDKFDKVVKDAKMYAHSFAGPDGHQRKVLYMDKKALKENQDNMTEAQDLQKATSGICTSLV